MDAAQSRIVRLSAGDRNYHIFYAFLHGATAEEKGLCRSDVAHMRLVRTPSLTLALPISALVTTRGLTASLQLRQPEQYLYLKQSKSFGDPAASARKLAEIKARFPAPFAVFATYQFADSFRFCQPDMSGASAGTVRAERDRFL